MNIVIVNLRRSGLTLPQTQVFNLGRSSPDKLFKALSNDFTHKDLHKTKATYQVATVEEAVQSYETDLHTKVRLGVKQKIVALRHLYNECINLTKQNKDIYFGCWCMDELNPKPYDHVCHCQPLRKIILNKWNKDTINNPAFIVQAEIVNNNQPILGFNGLKKQDNL